jgi:hypothetical protein
VSSGHSRSLLEARRICRHSREVARGTWLHRHSRSPRILPEQPTKVDFLINLKTAKTLDITIPPKLLALADGVIESHCCNA